MLQNTVQFQTQSSPTIILNFMRLCNFYGKNYVLNTHFGFLNAFALLLKIGHLQTLVSCSGILLYMQLILFIVVFVQQLLFVTTLIFLEEMQIFDANISCSLLPSRSVPFCRNLVLSNMFSSFSFFISVRHINDMFVIACHTSL